MSRQQQSCSSAVGLKPCTQHFTHRARIDVARICMVARGASGGRKLRIKRARAPPRAGKFFFPLCFLPMTTTTSRATSSYKECCWSICSSRDRYKPTRFCSAISHASFLNVHPLRQSQHQCKTMSYIHAIAMQNHPNPHAITCRSTHRSTMFVSIQTRFDAQECASMSILLRATSRVAPRRRASGRPTFHHTNRSTRPGRPLCAAARPTRPRGGAAAEAAAAPRRLPATTRAGERRPRPRDDRGHIQHALLHKGFSKHDDLYALVNAIAHDFF